MRSVQPPRLRPGYEYTAMESPHRRRVLIGAQTVWSRPASRSGDPCGRFHMHRMKRIASLLDIEADRVDNAVGTNNGGLYGALVVRIGGDLFEAVALGPPRTSRGDAHRGAGGAQMARDATA